MKELSLDYVLSLLVDFYDLKKDGKIESADSKMQEFDDIVKNLIDSDQRNLKIIKNIFISF